jgi:CubicO group peptidase (beta-lactamase class C family)
MSSGLGESLEYVNDPDTRWFYNTPAYSRLLPVLEVVSGLDANQLTGQWLTTTIGAADTRWVPRRSGPNTRGLATSARDLGRVGVLVLSGGTWQGAEAIPRAWLGSSASASQPMNPSYGRLIWLNSGAAWEDWDHRGQQAGRFVPAAPSDLLIARGVGDRRIYVLPSRGLVVVRLGAAARVDGDRVDLQQLDRGLWALIMAAARG